MFKPHAAASESEEDDNRKATGRFPSFLINIPTPPEVNSNRLSVEESSNGSTFSSYNPFIRAFYSMACILITYTTILHSYTYYFQRDRWYLYTTVNLSHFCYIFLILVRIHTAYMENGIEEFGFYKIRKK